MQNIVIILPVSYILLSCPMIRKNSKDLPAINKNMKCFIFSLDQISDRNKL